MYYDFLKTFTILYIIQILPHRILVQHFPPQTVVLLLSPVLSFRRRIHDSSSSSVGRTRRRQRRRIGTQIIQIQLHHRADLFLPSVRFPPEPQIPLHLILLYRFLRGSRRLIPESVISNSMLCASNTKQLLHPPERIQMLPSGVTRTPSPSSSVQKLSGAVPRSAAIPVTGLEITMRLQPFSLFLYSLFLPALFLLLPSVSA